LYNDYTNFFIPKDPTIFNRNKLERVIEKVELIKEKEIKNK